MISLEGDSWKYGPDRGRSVLRHSSGIVNLGTVPGGRQMSPGLVSLRHEEDLEGSGFIPLSLKTDCLHYL